VNPAAKPVWQGRVPVSFISLLFCLNWVAPNIFQYPLDTKNLFTKPNSHISTFFGASRGFKH